MEWLLRKVWLIPLLAGAAVASASTMTAPKTVKATYAAYMNGMVIGTISEQFEADAGTYRIVSETRPMGLATFLQRQPLKFMSTGELTREGLRPAHFEGRRSASDPPQVSADFDWAQGQLNMKYNGRVESVPIIAGAQDRLSIMYQLMFVAHPEKARQVDLWMTNGRKFDHYRYRIMPDVELDTPIGRLKTLHFVKQREPGGSHAEVWLSTQHQHVPVKVVIIEKDGMRFEQIIQTLELRD
jgi:hypothetical protein